jgi:hypothetical protein
MPEQKAAAGSIHEAIAAFDQAHEFARRVLPPEEERARLAVPWGGGYRWFRASNVVCLEKARRLRAEGRI